MKVVLSDGTTFTCGGYKALDSGGVVLTDDPKRKHVIGYVPEASLAYILPDGVEPGGNGDEDEDGEGGENDDGEGGENDDESEDSEVEASEDGEGEENGDESEDSEGGENDDDEFDDGDDGGEESDEASEDDGSSDDESEDSGEQSDDAKGAVSDDDVGEHVVSAGVETAVEGVTTAASDDAVGEHTHEDVVERVEQLESRVDGLDGRVDAMTEQLADIVARGTVGEDEARSPEDVRNIRGIGEAYATRLRASGIDTVAALSEASDAEIAAAVDISERRAAELRRRAKTAVESEVTDDE